MADEWYKKIATISTVAVLCILVYFLVTGSSKIPSQQKYPDRQPIRFWHMWTAEWKIIIDDYCQGFNESQDLYEVIPLSLPKGIAASKFLLSVAGGEPPDCMAQWHQVVPQFADSKLIMPLDQIMSPSELEHFNSSTYPVARKIASYKGRPYCMPLDLNIRACYYRLDYLEEAGLLPEGASSRTTTLNDFQHLGTALPTTLEDLNEWGRKLHVFDQKGRLARLGFMPQKLLMFASVFGGGFYDWEQNTLSLNSTENLKALIHLTEQRKVLGFERMQRFETSLTGNFGANWPFISGQTAIVIDGQWRVQQLKKFAPNLPYTTAPIPPPDVGGKDRAGWVYSNFMIIPTGAKNPEGAWEFIKYWMGADNPERAAEFYTRCGWLPTSARISNSDTYRAYVRENPQFQTFIDLLDSPNMEPTPPVPFQLLLYDLIHQADESAMRGTLRPSQALRQLDEDVADILQRRKEEGYEK